MNPRISIIVPVYNVERFLGKCLDSVLASTFEDWECICIDDGSTDGSGAILDEYADRDARFRVEHRENAGVAEARNRGLELAVGEYVVFIDSDDAVTPAFLGLGVAAMERHLDVDTWIAQRRYVDEYYCTMERQPPRLVPRLVEDPNAQFLIEYSRFYFFCVWGRFLRRSIIEAFRLRFIDIRISEDFVFMVEYFHCSRMALVDAEAEVIHCEREGSLVRVSSPYRMHDSVIAVESLSSFNRGGGALRMSVYVLFVNRWDLSAQCSIRSLQKIGKSFVQVPNSNL